MSELSRRRQHLECRFLAAPGINFEPYSMQLPKLQCFLKDVRVVTKETTPWMQIPGCTWNQLRTPIALVSLRVKKRVCPSVRSAESRLSRISMRRLAWPIFGSFICHQVLFRVAHCLPPCFIPGGSCNSEVLREPITCRSYFGLNLVGLCHALYGACFNVGLKFFTINCKLIISINLKREGVGTCLGKDVERWRIEGFLTPPSFRYRGSYIG